LRYRLNACVDLAVRHSFVRRKDNSEKKLPIVLTNFDEQTRPELARSRLDIPLPLALMRVLRNIGLRSRDLHDGDALMEIDCMRG